MASNAKQAKDKEECQSHNEKEQQKWDVGMFWTQRTMIRGISDEVLMERLTINSARISMKIIISGVEALFGGRYMSFM